MRTTYKLNYSTVFAISTIALLVIFVWNKFYMSPDTYEANVERISAMFPRSATIASSRSLLPACAGGDVQPNLDKPLVQTFGDNKWTLDNSICAGLDDKRGKAHFQKITLKSILGDMPLFIHNPKQDGVSSRVISGNFEPHIFKTLLSLLKLDPEVSMLDIGAHIGINALQAAKYGRNVIAIEATTESAEHICASAIAGNVQNKITIVRNAISNVHTQVKFLRSPWGDFGGVFIDDDDQSGLRKIKMKYDGKKAYNFDNYTIINSFMLDDLLQLPNICAFRKVLIKMDVEGSEHLALDGARKFFEQVDVQGVLMEYRWHVERSTKNVILDFFENFKFDPFDFSGGRLKKLEPRRMKNHDVLWLPQSESSTLNGMKVF